VRVAIENAIDDMVARVCAHDLADELRAAGVEVAQDARGREAEFDALVLRGADRAAAERIAAAKAANPSIRVFLSDPKMSAPEYLAAARSADVLTVSSVEQREAFLPLNSNVLVRFMFPRFAAPPARGARAPGPIRVGYHGNRMHLEAMAGSLDQALERLADEVPCELVLVYNFAGLGRARAGLPDPAKVPTRHIQWSWDAYAGPLADCDIGLVPNLLPIARRDEALARTRVEGLDTAFEPFDYLHRFKASSNPGRLYPFAWYGVPIVADLTPSNAQFLRDGESGFLCEGPHGWYAALRALARDPDLRARMAANARAPFDAALARRTAEFLAALRAPLAPPPAVFDGARRIDDETARYVPPRRPGVARLLWSRWFG
jgi:hypothetical protein